MSKRSHQLMWTQLIQKDNRVIYCGSLSKSLAPGLRLGFLVADPELIQQARMLRRLLLRHPPALVQRTVALFLQLGHYDSHIIDNSGVKKTWKHVRAALEQIPAWFNEHSLNSAVRHLGRGPAACDARLLAQSCADKAS